MIRMSWLLKLSIPAVISGAIGWCSWTTKTLYEIKQDMAVLKAEVKPKLEKKVGGTLNAQVSD